MKLLVLCQVCGKKLAEVNKDYISDNDLLEYEKSSRCEEHGGNEYQYDENGIQVAQLSFIVKAVKSVD